VDLDVDYDGITNLNQIQEEASVTYEHVGNPYIMPNINIKYGMAGHAVKWVQWELKQHGYNPGKIDGIFLDKTEKAVRDFQKESRILVDGIVGKQTRKALIGR
jgi:peptidoglycan hydrolase-like protein with peptidoglycan-binding domain